MEKKTNTKPSKSVSELLQQIKKLNQEFIAKTDTLFAEAEAGLNIAEQEWDKAEKELEVAEKEAVDEADTAILEFVAETEEE